MTWTQKDIEQLKREGNIRGFTEMSKQNTSKNIPQKGSGNIPSKSKALTWLKWNLWYWANEKALTLEQEYRFDPDRMFRFDFAFPSIMAAIEFEGGIYLSKSGHNTAKHFTKDTDKYNRATILGWRVIRVTAKNYKTALQQLNDLIK